MTEKNTNASLSDATSNRIKSNFGMQVVLSERGFTV